MLKKINMHFNLRENSYHAVHSIFWVIYFKGKRKDGGGKSHGVKTRKGRDRRNEESDAWWHQVTQKCHGGEEHRLRKSGTEKESRHPIAKAALNIVSSPEGCDIFLQSLLAVLISLHMSWMKIEFVWKRGRYYWLYHCLLIVSVSVHLLVNVSASDFVYLCACVCVCASIVRTRANQFITAMDCVSPIHHCQCSSPLQCQLI